MDSNNILVVDDDNYVVDDDYVVVDDDVSLNLIFDRLLLLLLQLTTTSMVIMAAVLCKMCDRYGQAVTVPKCSIWHIQTAVINSAEDNPWHIYGPTMPLHSSIILILLSPLQYF